MYMVLLSFSTPGILDGVKYFYEFPSGDSCFRLVLLLHISCFGSASRAARTIDAYRRAFLRWRSFASSKDEIQVFPARTEHMALYLQHVPDTIQSPSAVDSAIYGIQWAHNLAGIPSPTDSPIVHSISKAAKKLIGTRLVNKKELIYGGPSTP